MKREIWDVEREPYYRREPNWSPEGVREREIVYVVVTPPPGL
jgi:hypothetical protein